MPRRSRGNEWAQMRDGMLGRAKQTRGVEGREVVPDKACGKCKQFSDNAYASDGRGTCRVLKMGSNIAADPPELVKEGQAGLLTYFNTDASHCPEFDRMDLIDTDGSECADPQFRRAQRQMEKVGR